MRTKYSEPIRTTFIRTFGIALGVGTIVFLLNESGDDPAGSHVQHWVSWVAAVLWFSFGGHWVEILYLNHIRMSLPEVRWLETVVRLMGWYVGGCVLFVGMKITATMLGNPALESLQWWYGGFLFIIIELFVHAIVLAGGKNCFWNGRG